MAELLNPQEFTFDRATGTATLLADRATHSWRRSQLIRNAQNEWVENPDYHPEVVAQVQDGVVRFFHREGSEMPSDMVPEYVHAQLAERPLVPRSDGSWIADEQTLQRCEFCQGPDDVFIPSGALAEHMKAHLIDLTRDGTVKPTPKAKRAEASA